MLDTGSDGSPVSLRLPLLHDAATIRAMTNTRPAAIVVPMEEEFTPYRGLLADVRRLDDAGPWEVYAARAGARSVVLIISDVGPANAAAATERMIARYDPRVVLHGGSAGAHNPDLLPGDVVLATRCVIHTTRSERAARQARGLSSKMIRFRRGGGRVHLEYAAADPALLARATPIAAREAARFADWVAPGWPTGVARRPARALTGVVASADAWTSDPEELRALREDFGAECEDMESAFVGQVCALHGLSFLTVRAISNNDALRGLAATEIAPAVAAAGARAARILAAIAAEALSVDGV